MKLLTFITGDIPSGVVEDALRGAFRIKESTPVEFYRFTRSGSIWVTPQVKGKDFIPWARSLFPEAEDPRVLRSLVVEGMGTPDHLVKLFASLMSSGWSVEFVVVRGTSDKKFQSVEEVMRDSVVVIGSDLPREEVTRRLRDLRGISSAVTGAV